MKRDRCALQALQRMVTLRLSATEQRLARVARAAQEALRRCDELEQQRTQAQAAPLQLARAALQDGDLAALRALPAQRAAAAAIAAGVDARLEPARRQLGVAQQQRHATARALQRQRARDDHLGWELSRLQRRLDALAADEAAEDAADSRVGR